MNYKKGFTLIELLIVIALLGALIVGLLAALDPIEQINRGRDSGIESTATQLLNAYNRYYANRQAYPWGVGALGVTTADTRTTDFDNTTATSLVVAGELKTNFAVNAASTLPKISISAAANGPVRLCFPPSSKAFRTNTATIYNSTGTATITGCPSATMTTCYRCYN